MLVAREFVAREASGMEGIMQQITIDWKHKPQLSDESKQVYKAYEKPDHYNLRVTAQSEGSRYRVELKVNGVMEYSKVFKNFDGDHTFKGEPIHYTMANRVEHGKEIAESVKVAWKKERSRKLAERDEMWKRRPVWKS